ncbi:MAG: chemotaxis protein CheA [Betaproteobacteria bacterium RBG_16_56_24]|nr:MAG: chemotaxis protein CheA [Betaproteobacteria bacterium RBG_16_56_24]
MDIQPALQTFIAESSELLRDMEEALLQLEKIPEDPDALNAVFRAVHTIKGSSGVFGFDDIVAFTHLKESVLAEVRADEISVDADLTALLLACKDHLALLIDCQTEGRAELDETERETGLTLAAELEAYLKFTAPFPEIVTPAPQEPVVESMGGGVVSSDAWHISLRFGKDILRNGMDPLSFIHFLGTLGEILSVVTLFDTMPDADEMNPESCYLGMEINFRGPVNKADIDKVFEFVRDDCIIHILPPRSKVLDYIQLINILPEDKSRIGEILVHSGALTQNELEEGLCLQQSRGLQLDGKATDGEQLAPKLGEILVEHGMVHNEVVEAALSKQNLIKERKALESSFVRVRADKLDELITLVGELVIAGASTQLLAQRTGNSELIESTLGVEALVGQIRDGALKLRMVPIGETFNRFNRVVRDLGQELDKQIELVLIGAETELDKSMIEKISDPLMHMVRNAVDHGIELPVVRQQNGKPETGKLYLNAYHDSGSIVIEVGDDGVGLDSRKILALAIKRGLATADQQLSDQEIFKFIMEPGFSTAERVTNVSGRGMGMDVVKRNVEALRGSVTIDSVAGKGTTMAIRLPLTLAIIDGFLVGVGKAAYVLPLDTVVECMELSAEDRAVIRNRSFINLRDEVLPLLRLRDVFETSDEAGRRENIVIVKCDGQQAGLVVDSLLGEFQTVIKPLGMLFEKLAGVSGSTILGSGEVALILDVPMLVQKAVTRETQQDFRQQANNPVTVR